MVRKPSRLHSQIRERKEDLKIYGDVMNLKYKNQGGAPSALAWAYLMWFALATLIALIYFHPLVKGHEWVLWLIGILTYLCYVLWHHEKDLWVKNNL